MTVFFIIIGILAVSVTIMLAYHNVPFDEALEIADTMEKVDNDYYFYGESDVGFIIFSGAKVDERAYSYIAELIHEEGHTVVIPSFHFYLSAFGKNRGLEIMELNPQIDKWILIGHSLGGMPISRIAAEEPEKLEGIAFLATYALVDLSKTDISAIRITADNDGVMDNDWMAGYSGNLPENSTEIMLEGANHQGFGAYAARSSDGEATITWKQQQEKSVQLILNFFEDQINEI